VTDLPAGHTPVDSYETPAALREQLLVRNPADAFPHAAAVNRRLDVDHTIPYHTPTKAAHPAKPESATSDPTPAEITG
jgi:hypothetical protein